MFIGQDGENQFSLKIMDYQFPGNRNNDYDANWVLVSIEAKTPEWQWEKTDPALLTWEIQGLVNWLEAVVADREQWKYIAFIEPNLSFEVMEKNGEDLVLMVYLALEYKPPFVSAHEAKVEIHTTLTEIGDWIHDLQEQLLSYPIEVVVKTI